MQSLKQVSVLVVVSCLLLMSSFAAPAIAVVHFAAPGIAGSVTNLSVGDDVYDVAFVGNISHANWVNQLDFSNEDDAEAAALALAGELNAAGATAMRFLLPSGNSFDHTNAVTWYAANETTLFGENTLRSGSTWILGNPLPGGATAPINSSSPLAAQWTLVEPPPVPTTVPFALAVMTCLLAGAGIAGIRRLQPHRD